MKFQNLFSRIMAVPQVKTASLLFLTFYGTALGAYGLTSFVIDQPASPAAAIGSVGKACYTAREINARQLEQNEVTAVKNLLASELKTNLSELKALNALLAKTNKEISGEKKTIPSTSAMRTVEKKILKLKAELNKLTQKEVLTKTEAARLAKVPTELEAAESKLEAMKTSAETGTSNILPLADLKTSLIASIKTQNTNIARIRSEQKKNAAAVTAAAKLTKAAQAKSCGVATTNVETTRINQTSKACYSESEKASLIKDLERLTKEIEEYPAKIVEERANQATDVKRLADEKKDSAAKKKLAPTEAKVAAAKTAYEAADSKYQTAITSPITSKQYANRFVLAQKRSDAYSAYMKVLTNFDNYKYALIHEAETTERMQKREATISKLVNDLNNAQEDIDAAQKLVNEATICAPVTNTNNSSSNTSSNYRNYINYEPSFTCTDDYDEPYSSSQCSDGTQVCDTSYCPVEDDTYVDDSCSTDSEFDTDNVEEYGRGWTIGGSIFGIEVGNAICGAEVGLCRRGYEWDTEDPTPNGNWTCILREKNNLGRRKCAELGIDPEKIINSAICPGR